MRKAILGFCLSALASCITGGGGTVSTPTLEFLGDQNFSQGGKYLGTPLGGLSGICREGDRDTYLAISDDKSEFAPARFYKLNVTWGLKPCSQEKTDCLSSHLGIEPAGMVTLTRKDGKPFEVNSIDPEGIVWASRDEIIVSSEGNGKSNPRVPPAIFVHGAEGRLRSSLPVPEKFLPNPTGDLTVGVRHNAAFEGLSLSPDRKFLFVMTEGPLAQDDTDADRQKGSRNRGIIFRRGDDGAYVFVREFAYHVEAAKSYREGPTPLSYSNSISEILALNDHELLVLERGGLELPNKGWRSFERIYYADIADASDVAAVPALASKGYTPAKKQLVLDLDDVLPQLAPDFRSLDNLEGMSFGPTLPDGSKSLLLISDDNFSPSQRTQALLFRLRKP